MKVLKFENFGVSEHWAQVSMSESCSGTSVYFYIKTVTGGAYAHRSEGSTLFSDKEKAEELFAALCREYAETHGKVTA